MQPFTCAMLSLFAILTISISATSDTGADFIKASCDTTRYPDLCYKTLSPFASTALAKGQDLSMRDGEAVADCLENISDSIDEVKQSMVAMKDLDGPDFNEIIGNVKTWVSAALTDEDTCMEGFEENDGKMKDTIRGYIVNVAQLTSNALALISMIS
ncbi:21 kDa protein [Tanacetum coccineum]